MKEEKEKAGGPGNGLAPEEIEEFRSDEQPPSTVEPEAESLERLKKELAEKAEEAGKYRDLYVRERAELENFKKRMQREKAEALKYENENLIRELLPTIDNLSRAIEHAKGGSEGQALREGVEMVLKTVLGTLQRFEMNPIAAVGERFDPGKHEAIAYLETDQCSPDMVIEEHQKGYFYKDRLLRPALVTVSKSVLAKEEQVEETEEDDLVEKPQEDD
jgi:molecular chaperone GrpE